jgi:ABC-type transport system substrate-binding protein
MIIQQKGEKTMFCNLKISGRRIFFCLAAVALFASMALVATNATAEQQATKGGKFTVHINRDIGGFDHIKVPQGGMGRHQVLFAVHDFLFYQDDQGNLIPRLGIKATHSEDYKSWKVELRKGVKFSNGEELTSEAYVHHFNRLLSHTLADTFREQLGPRLERVVAIDKYNIDFQFSESNTAFDSVMAGQTYVFYLNAPGFAKANEGKPDYNRMACGAGPYMLKEWIPGKGVTLVRNPNYWNPKEQHADEIFYRITGGKETSGPWNALRAADLDAGWSLNGSILPLARKNKDLNVITGNRGMMHWMVNFNFDHKPLDNLLVRRALVHAIDRRAIIKVVTKGEAVLANQSFPQGSPWHIKGLEYPGYDPEKAMALLKEYGKPVPKIELWTMNIPSFKNVTVMIQAMWKKVGVETELKVGGRGPTGLIFNVIKGATPAWVMVGGPTIHPAIFNQSMHSKHRGNNWRVKSPELDAAAEKVRAARGREEILKAHEEFERAKIDVLPSLPLEYAIAAVITQKDIRGIEAPTTQLMGYHNIYRVD